MAAIDKIERLIKVLEISQEMGGLRTPPVWIERAKLMIARGNQTRSEIHSRTHRLPIEHVSKILDIRLLPQCSQPV
jgi:hypothetical protein